MRMGLEKTGAGTGAGLGRGNGVWLSGAVKERKGRPVLPPPGSFNSDTMGCQHR